MSIGLKLLTLFIPELIKGIADAVRRGKARREAEKRQEVIKRRRAAIDAIHAESERLKRERNAAAKKRVAESFDRDRLEIVGEPKDLDRNPY